MVYGQLASLPCPYMIEEPTQFLWTFLTRVSIPFMRQASPRKLASSNTVIQVVGISAYEIGKGKHLDHTQHLLGGQVIAVVLLLVGYKTLKTDELPHTMPKIRTLSRESEHVTLKEQSFKVETCLKLSHCQVLWSILTARDLA